MSSIDVDVTELLKLADDLRTAGDDLITQVKPAVAKGALNIKNALRADMAASGHFGQVARSITYDTTSGAGWVEAQIGAVTGGGSVGNLAHFAYFGGAHGGGGTVRDPQEALDEEGPRLAEAISAIVGDLL